MLVPGDVCLVEPVADAATDDVEFGTVLCGTLGGAFLPGGCLAYDRIKVATEGVLATGRSIDVCAAGRSDLIATLDIILLCQILSITLDSCISLLHAVSL